MLAIIASPTILLALFVIAIAQIVVAGYVAARKGLPVYLAVILTFFTGTIGLVIVFLWPSKRLASIDAEPS